ncbi:heme biosynthesis protein HemY [Tepidicella baoligensis]|uniref:heme biosynthesis protein HemY n=1 Tax=Tepidicella baoligensis TaxID=2707016 RepID=UPI0015DA8CF1|nr:heme biosynthesis HemY N-terminal domain-containing protein [Tepidicella baoligensis]
MRAVFWFLFLAALAVALALLVGDNTATVTVFWHPWRLDMSLNLVLFTLVAGFVLLHLTLRGLSLLRGLPQQAHRWRAHQLERAVYVSLLDAVTYQLAGRFVRAQAAARHALQVLEGLPADGGMARRSQWQVLALLLEAESAQALGNAERRDQAMEALVRITDADASTAREGAILRAAAWALKGRDATAARDWLRLLPQGAARRIQAVRLRLKLAQLERDTPVALDMVRLLTKHKAFSPAVAASLLKGLLNDSFRQAHDLAQLLQVWQALEPHERRDPALALQFSQRWQQLEPLSPPCATEPDAEHPASPEGWSHCAEALETVWRGYATLSDRQRQACLLLLEAYLPRLGAHWVSEIEAAQQARPADAGLQYLAGQAFMQRQLWGKASQLLTMASHGLQDPELLRRTWCSLAQLAEQRGDEEAAREAWKRAALS